MHDLQSNELQVLRDGLFGNISGLNNDKDMAGYHVPVLQEEVIALLNPQKNENAIDGTVGDGGHAEAILECIGPKGKLLGIDLDPKALEISKKRLERFGDRFIPAQGNFSAMEEIAAGASFPAPNMILLDLGLRTAELESSGRGFSFKKDEPLDMRFDPANQLTAAHILNQAGKDELITILRSYGEEPLAKEIAEGIVSERKKNSILRTVQLSEIVLSAYRKKLKSKKEIPWIGGIHPATRTFQAIRIRTNDELEHLRAALPQALRLLPGGGRLAVISFHSLEDRIVKRFFKESSFANASEDRPMVQILTKNPVVPKEEEINKNPASRSAKLRVLKKIK